MKPTRPPVDPAAPAATLAVVQAELADWRRAHPQATFADMEAAVETSLARVRASLLGALLPTEGEAQAGEGEAPARPVCDACVVPMVARGRHRRPVQVWGDQPVELERTYWTCPRCGAGHFPPG